MEILFGELPGKVKANSRHPSFHARVVMFAAAACPASKVPTKRGVTAMWLIWREGNRCE